MSSIGQQIDPLPSDLEALTKDITTLGKRLLETEVRHERKLQEIRDSISPSQLEAVISRAYGEHLKKVIPVFEAGIGTALKPIAEHNEKLEGRIEAIEKRIRDASDNNMPFPYSVLKESDEARIGKLEDRCDSLFKRIDEYAQQALSSWRNVETKLDVEVVKLQVRVAELEELLPKQRATFEHHRDAIYTRVNASEDLLRDRMNHQTHRMDELCERLGKLEEMAEKQPAPETIAEARRNEAYARCLYCGGSYHSCEPGSNLSYTVRALRLLRQNPLDRNLHAIADTALGMWRNVK